MKKYLFSLLVLAMASTAQAQVVLSNTTLSGAITATQTSVVLASASASSGSTVGAPAANQILYVGGEAMLIRSISGTTAQVVRGYDGTNAAAHPTSSVVITGPQSGFQRTDAPPGIYPGGACTLAASGVRPWVNVLNANVFMCRSSVWTGTNVAPITFNSVTPY